MADLILIEQLQAFLIAQGAVRAPGTTGSVPTCWLDPRDGAPQPGVDKLAAETVTVTLKPTGGTPPPWFEEAVERRTVDIIVRAAKSPQGELTHRVIRGLLSGKRLFMMGALLVQESQLWRHVQPLGSDEHSYDTVQSFIFSARVKSLAGTTYP
jgi:hypothetical protein